MIILMFSGFFSEFSLLTKLENSISASSALFLISCGLGHTVGNELLDLILVLSQGRQLGLVFRFQGATNPYIMF